MRNRCLVIGAVLLSGWWLIPRCGPVTSASLVGGDDRRVALSIPTCKADHTVKDRRDRIGGHRTERHDG
jgi:hypothetical protein